MLVCGSSGRSIILAQAFARLGTKVTLVEERKEITLRDYAEGKSPLEQNEEEKGNEE